MTLDRKLKEKILAVLLERRTNFAGSDARFATSLGISSAQYSRIRNGELERVLSDANWISIARKLDVILGDRPEWHPARTPVYDFVSRQLSLCQSNSSSLLLCDLTDIGKTFTVKHYCKTNQNAIYVDCSQVKSKFKLVKYIAKEFGVGTFGTYSEVYADLVFYLRSLPNPLVVLDEAGDLEYSAFLELKALWNATEHYCGWYMMGANALKHKITRFMTCNKVGYSEIYSRYGEEYQKASPDSDLETRKFKDAIVAIIAKANADSGMDIQKLVALSKGSPRRLYKEIIKQRSLKKSEQ
jgi:hypothetical protein